MLFSAPSTDRIETLPHDQNLAVFYNPASKIRGGALPPKNWGPKTCKISVNFGSFQTLIANISATISKIGRRYKLWQLLLRLMKKVR